MLGPDLIQCSLCQGALPASQDEVFLGHMRDQHRAYFDLDFMFAVFCLSKEDKGVMLDAIKDHLAKKTSAKPRLIDENNQPKDTI